MGRPAKRAKLTLEETVNEIMADSGSEESEVDEDEESSFDEMDCSDTEIDHDDGRHEPNFHDDEPSYSQGKASI